MIPTLESLVGSRLVIGFPGTSVTPAVIEQFKRTDAGGVIFFRINFESAEQIRRVITDLENALERKLLVCVDHEGGRVIMYRSGVTVFPDNLAFGRAASVDDMRARARIEAKELRALGTDVNFSPVVDVLTSDYSPNIGIRAYGGSPQRVAELGSAYIEALQAGGVSACAKHFPGSGHNTIDAHLKLPTVQLDWKEMMETHVQPFMAAIKSGVDTIMSSHPKYPRLDPANLATFSRRIMTDCLRDELGFKGVIVSDDLEMGAVTEAGGGIDAAAVKAAAAGHDLILSCHDFDAQTRAFKGLVEAYRGRLLPKDELEASVERVEKLRAKRPKRFEGEIGPDSAGEPLAVKVARNALEVAQDPQRLLPLAPDRAAGAAVVFPRLSDMSARIMIEPDFDHERRFLEERWPAEAKVSLYGLEASEAEIEVAAEIAKNAPVTIFFCFDAHLHPKQKTLLDRLQTASKRFIVVFLRDPYDRAFLGPRDTGLLTFGFRRCQIDAALEKITGRVPVHA